MDIFPIHAARNKRFPYIQALQDKTGYRNNSLLVIFNKKKTEH